MTGETGTARRPQPRPGTEAARLPRQRDSSAVAQLRLLVAVGTDTPTAQRCSVSA
ncbi:hypothetical protein ABZ749_30235 [Micromonospora sp. NPDC047753]|uniref:hypothetical protein n=1 Tax=Micromonospora sp. NPDC047753 TaxID=3154817 RepID=UPI0033C03474